MASSLYCIIVYGITFIMLILTIDATLIQTSSNCIDCIACDETFVTNKTQALSCKGLYTGRCSILVCFCFSSFITLLNNACYIQERLKATENGRCIAVTATTTTKSGGRQTSCDATDSRKGKSASDVTTTNQFLTKLTLSCPSCLCPNLF